MILLKFLKIKCKLLCKRLYKFHRKKSTANVQNSRNSTKSCQRKLSNNKPNLIPCKFQWTAMSHILLSNDIIDDLQLASIISNVTVATYENVCYLDKLLSPIANVKSKKIYFLGWKLFKFHKKGFGRPDFVWYDHQFLVLVRALPYL